MPIPTATMPRFCFLAWGLTLASIPATGQARPLPNGPGYVLLALGRLGWRRICRD